MSAILVDHDAERAVLGSMLLDPAAVERAEAELEPHDFDAAANRAVFSAMLAVFGRGERVDEVTVASQLRETGRLADAGGISRLSQLTESTPTAANVAHYSSIVAGLSWRRQMLQHLERARRDAAEGKGTDAEIAARITSGLEQLGRRDHLDPFGGQWRWLSHRDKGAWLTEPPPPRRYLLETKLRNSRAGVDEPTGFLPDGRVGMLAAEGGAGKSWALVQLAMSVASGADWLGAYRVVRPGPVLLVLAEEDHEELRRRLYHAAEIAMLTKERRDEAMGKIVALALAGTSPRFLDEHGAPTLAFAAFRRNIEALSSDWRLLCFDPLSRFAGPDTEKDNAAATRMVEIFEQLSQAPGRPTVIVAHHTNKASRDQAKGNGASAARGSSALTDGFRWQANLGPWISDDGEDEDSVCLRVTKSNYGALPPALRLTRSEAHDGALVRPAPSSVPAPPRKGLAGPDEF